MIESQILKIFNSFKITIFKRIRSLECELDKISNGLKSNENRINSLEKKLWNFPDEMAKEIACDQFLRSIETDEEGKIISEEEEKNEENLFDF